MDNLNTINIKDFKLLETIAGIDSVPLTGAYNIRKNSEGSGRRSTEKVQITSKTDKSGIDIKIQPGVKGETVHIPVIITESGINETVYNDFYVGDDADVLIVAGCGIHNDGCESSEHDGVHRFFIGKNAHVKYVEKHYGEGEGTGKRILNPVTEVYMQPHSYCEMEMVQIKGVDSTVRTTKAELGEGAKMLVLERLMTHGEQSAQSDIDIFLNGAGASAQIISRSVAKNDSVQIFRPTATGNAPCHAHVQCDSIIMDNAKIQSIPAIAANHSDAQIIHEAAIGRINNEQLLKLMTLGLSETDAEEIIIQGFLK